MNKQNLIMTSTANMNREEWLAFRQPLNHVKEFLESWYRKESDPAGFPFGFLKSAEGYEFLKYIFETQAWKDFVFPVVGGSEISSLVGLNKYQSVIELYYEKVGVKDVFNDDNEAMFWGRELEEHIAEKWQYWETDAETMLSNFKAKRIVRKCRRINYYVQNKKFPWIMVSLDRIINQKDGQKEGSLECKCISAWAADMWEDGIPPMYVCQLQAQIMTFEFEFGEMAILKDGRHFQVYPFDKGENICNRLKEESFKFFQMVKAGIEQFLLYKAAPDNLKETHLAQIDHTSPEPDGSTAYETYLKSAYKDQGYEVPGGPVELHLAKAYKYYDKEVKQLEDKQRECSNKLKGFIKDAARIDLGLEGYVSWKADAKGTRRMLIKVTPEEGFKPDHSIIKSEPLEELNPFI
jgi:putative phage-type endonuclease